MKIPIICANDRGQVNTDVYVAYQWRHSGGDRDLCRIFIGTRAGIALQYDADGSDKWDGNQHTNFSRGAWTPCYSRGNYGRNYACGGNWSGHTNALCGKRGVDTRTDIMVCGSALVECPSGIARDIAVTDVDCSISWAIWYRSAADALRARLTRDEIAVSQLPEITRNHILRAETPDYLAQLSEVIAINDI